MIPEGVFAKMMRIFVVPVLLAACAAAQGQVAAAPAPQQQTKPGTPASVQPPASAAHPEDVGANETVITVHGFCPDPAKSGAECTTVISKEQFEKIMAAVNQTNAPMPPPAIRNLAERYVQIMAFASQAEKLGLDKDPKFQELMRIVRINSLAEAYHRSMEEKYRSPSDADVQAYYDKNITRFEQVKLARVFIPRVNPKAPTGGIDDFAQRAQKLADSMRERAAKGEDLDKLQQEAYHTLGLNPPSLNTDVGTRRRGSGTLPPNVENDVFALKSGEVTRVEPEPSGFQFYKLQGRDTLTLAQVKSEIVAAIRKGELEASTKSVMDPIHTDLNETYFGPRSAGTPLAIPPPRSPQYHPPAPATAPGSSATKPVEP
jgi:PPIC-type PPIASE domain